MYNCMPIMDQLFQDHLQLNEWNKSSCEKASDFYITLLKEVSAKGGLWLLKDKGQLDPVFPIVTHIP